MINISPNLILGSIYELHLQQVFLNLLSNAIKYKQQVEL